MAQKTIVAEIDGKQHSITADIPDDATPHEIESAVRAYHAANQPKSVGDHVSDFFTSAGKELNPIEMAKGLYHAATNPSAAIEAYGKQNQELAHKTAEAFKSGRYTEGVRHALGYVLNGIPGFGAGVDAAGDLMQEGKYGEALGKATGLGLAMAGPGAVIKAGSSIKLPALGIKTGPVGEALNYANREGIPLDLATTTDNGMIRGAQQVAGYTAGGSIPAVAGKARQAQAMSVKASELAGLSHPTAIVPEQAGAGVTTALTKKAAGHAAEADTAYAKFRNIEADPANAQSVQQGTKQTPVLNVQGNPMLGKMQTVPVMEDVAMPTDLAAIKAELKPIHDDMVKWMEPAKRNSSAGFQAIKSIIDGPNYVPASQAEAGLGGLKQLAREGAGRNAGLAKFVIPKLQAAIDGAASAAGPDALAAIKEGRAATVSQYGTKAILDQLRTEPVQTFQQLTWKKDSGIDFLRKVKDEAPAEMPKVGRALLDDIFDKAKVNGGFDMGKSLSNYWENLGPETKKLLYPNADLRADLNNFFTLAKRMPGNVNTSGTALATAASATMNTAIGGIMGHFGMLGEFAGAQAATGTLTALMYNPAFVKALNRGMSLPVGTPAKAAAWAKVGSMLESREKLNPATTGQKKSSEVAAQEGAQ